jgi:serine phosphatase RsbU (regulator of sigma subunit)
LYESELRRVEQELELAHRIQVSLLPHEVPQIPGFSIAARSVSARQVGGDFYRYLSMPDGKFGVVVGDVSGKGVPSALYMAITITAMDTQIRQSTTPGHILRQLNSILYPRMRANRMNTGLLIAIFDPEHHSVQVANAGMIAPLIRADNDYEWVDVGGLPLGAISDSSYTSQTITMTPDTTVIMTSDGIIEAMNDQNEMFGFDRFYDAAQRVTPATPSQQILENLWTNVAGHIGDAEPHDDMTLVVIRAWDSNNQN